MVVAPVNNSKYMPSRARAFFSGSGVSRIGVSRAATGEWFLGANGNGKWDGAAADRYVAGFGQAGDVLLVGSGSHSGRAVRKDDHADSCGDLTLRMVFNGISKVSACGRR